MLKKYRNQIFQLLLNHPLGIDNFEVSYDNDEFIVKYLKSNPIFIFALSPSGSFDFVWPVATVFEPGFQVKPLAQEAIPSDKAIDFLRVWLEDDLQNFINEECEIDLWEEYKKRINLTPIKNEDYKDFSTFTKDEKRVIELGLNEIKLLINQRFTKGIEQQQIVEDRINYLAESLARAENKTDWKGILINTIISISIALSLDSKKGQELYNLFIQILQAVPYLH